MACTDVQTIQAGNGSKTQFSFDFPYIFKSEIHVYFWNVVTKEYDEKLTTDSTYPWQITDANPTIVEFTSTAPPSPATPTDPGEPTVDNVKIRRITKVDDIRALFNPGSAIRSDDLNKNFEQLRYAVQEANCQGIPDDVDAYLKEYYWDRFDNTIYQADAWRSDDATIATTAALDQRFQDEVSETFTKSELATVNKVMPDNDTALPTTGALNDYIDEVITNDIGTDGTGITVTDDGDGTITLGLADNTIDFDKIKDADQIKLADQEGDPDVVGTDNNIFTAQAATRRFNNYYQSNQPTTTNGIGIGQVWVDPSDDTTLYVWSGSTWVAVTSGGTFTTQPKVVYVDATSGLDTNDGHRISRPKKTIAGALSDINGDANGDGSIISVAPGIYAETLPLDIQKNDIGIIGQSLRTCIIHPKIPTSDQSSYDVNTPHSQELQTMFRVNSGSYFTNLTLTGLKASGTRGASGSLYTDATYGLPPNQGWNFAFYPNATIKKSPYIQNCTNFSDSQINNVNFTPHTPGEGAAGDLDSAPTGGGILVDGSVPATASPLRSIVCDSYTHTALDGPGLFVTNNGYTQCTSSYAFFNHAHITCINGGQANLAASTTDFGRYGLIADGKSSAAIFTSNVDGAKSSGSITFNVNQPAGGTGWFGDAQRPATNMLVEVNSVIYPILSATANTDSEGGNGWTVTISRPNPNKRSENLGLNGAISDNAAVSFYLRSMIASSGHTMEYVGSGTNYTALPENGGVPIEARQKIELNNGKIWTATTDHNGKFTIGGNQTDDPFFEVDQQLGFVTIPEGSIAFNLLSDETPQLGGNLDLNNFTVVDSSNTSVNGVVTKTGATASASLPVGTTAQRDSSPAAGMLRYNSTEGRFEGYTTFWGDIGGAVAISSAPPTNAATGDLWYDHDDGRTYVYYNDGDSNQWVEMSPFDGYVADGTVTPAKLSTGGPYWDSSGRLMLGTTTEGAVNEAEDVTISGTGEVGITLRSTNSGGGRIYFSDGTSGTSEYAGYQIYNHSNNAMIFGTNAVERMRILSDGTIATGGLTATPSTVAAGSYIQHAANAGFFGNNGDAKFGSSANNPVLFQVNGSEKMRIDTSGRVGINTSAPAEILHITGNPHAIVQAQASTATAVSSLYFADPNSAYSGYLQYAHTTDHLEIGTAGSEKVRIDSSGRMLINHTADAAPASYSSKLQLCDTSYEGSSLLLRRDQNNSSAPTLLFAKTRSTSKGGSTVVQDGDLCGQIMWFAGDGTDANSQVAYMQAAVDGTPGSNDTPGRLAFFTTADGASAGTERMRIDSSGNVQVKNGYFYVQTSSTGFTTSDGLGLISDGNSDKYVWNYENTSLRFGTNNTERVRIDSVGRPTVFNGDAYNVVIRSSNSAGTSNLFLACTPGSTGITNGGTGVTFQIFTNGNVQNTNNSYTGISDIKLKENIVDASSQWDDIKDLRVRNYNFIEGQTHTQIGVVAQEVETVSPGLVTESPDRDEDGNDLGTVTKSVNYSVLYMKAVKALQEAMDRIETLETKVAQLEANN